MPSLFFCILLLGLRVTESQASGLAPPQQVRLDADKETQTLSVTWEDGHASTFDVEILRTELMEMVLNETVGVTEDQSTGKHQWNWTSPVPLECTSLSVKVRSRDGQDVSEWSSQQILPGLDLPDNTDSQMYPEGKTVPVGSNMTFCCIVEEGQQFGSLWYKDTLVKENMLSRRTYATTMTNQGPSNPSGTNVVCSNEKKMIIAGAVVFVGYPPLPSDLVCETHDLISVDCQWSKGRDTYLFGMTRQTYYTLNGRNCPKARNSNMRCGLEQWDGNWTLVARNLLGEFRLTDAAELGHRVRPVAPVNLTTPEVYSWNASVGWLWKDKGFERLSLICQVQRTSHLNSSTQTYTGYGLNTVVLKDLQPDEKYSVKVRCGSQKNFWKWGEWSLPLSFQTKMDRPVAPDIWLWMDSDNLGRVLWKPLTKSESHGQISGYEVILWSPEENSQQTLTLPQSVYSLPINVTDLGSKVTVTVTARNPAGVSLPANVVIPRYLPDAEDTAISKVAFNGSGFPLSWVAHANASCGYVVDWYNTSCTQDCNVEWTRVAADNTNTMVQSGNFFAGVRYTFSLYACSSESTVLLERWHGYMQELVPSRTVPRLSPNQEGADVQLTWDQIPLEHQRGFILGYTVYLTNASHLTLLGNPSPLTLLANITDPQLTNHTVRNLVLGSYKFTVKAYTAAGEDGGATVSISLEPYTYWLIMEILVALGTMTCLLIVITIACYRKRKWVKKAFYPEIPEPKLPGDWGITQGTLDVKPSPHSMVHIVEDSVWDSSKEALVTVPEEDEEGTGDEAADTDEPASLRYYNQVVEEGSSSQRRPHASDSSASSTGSMDSGHTDVTYTGIQTSACSLAPMAHFQPQPDASQCVGGGGYRPQMQSASCPEEPQTGPEEHLQPPVGSFGGYQPQCSWKQDSPEADGDGLDQTCLGSPTSVTSSQFLLPYDTSEEGKEHPSSASTWFHNLLTGKP
ncbi:LIF receptor subunit alpha a isoform X1 [Oncorhynchus clarkii lewisi]|uniref:LIF receptor subunit alpha a isoform X1 n=1 Tax=Oncorhynchus clarkii lewisi TaxID=490388 RepID=UPI0039B8B1BD